MREGDEWREPFEILVRAIEDEAELHPFGRRMTRCGLLIGLEARLGVEAAFREHPEIADEVIDRPLVIAGLSRPGTSIPFERLAQDPSGLDPALRVLPAHAPALAVPEPAPALAAQGPLPPKLPAHPLRRLSRRPSSLHPPRPDPQAQASLVDLAGTIFWMRSDKPMRVEAFEGLLSPETMAVRPVYERCELEFTGDTERRMRAYLAKKPQGRFGRHAYAVAESEDLRRRRRLFARYPGFFRVPDEAI